MWICFCGGALIVAGTLFALAMLHTSKTSRRPEECIRDDDEQMRAVSRSQ